MELRQLEYFMAICQELHFTRAADKLGIAQPTLSQQIRILETELNTPLFDRIGKKIFITKAGEIFLRYCQQIFSNLEQARNEMQDLQNLQEGHISIGCSGSHLMISSLLAFHKHYPGIQISTEQLSTEETKSKLLNNELDIGIVFLPVEDSKNQLESVFLYTEELCLVVAADHELANNEYVRMEKLKSTPIVLLPKKYLIRQFIDQAAQARGFSFKPTAEMMFFEYLLNLVKYNIAVTILPKSYMSTVKSKQFKTISIIDPAIKKDMGIIYQKNKFMPRSVKMFIEELSQNLTQKSGVTGIILD